jgi:two-component system phosphate regulon sensor histidine kinase PhoR
MKKKKRLLWQLFLSYLFIIFLALASVTWYTLRSLQDWHLGQKASDLELQALLLERHILENLAPEKRTIIDALCKKIGERASTRITVILPSGVVIADSKENPANMDNHRDRPELKKALSGHVGKSTRFSHTLEKKMMYTGIPIKENNQIVAVIRTSIPLTTIEQAINTIRGKIAIGVVIVIGFAVMLSLLVSRSISRPIEEIKKWAGALADGNFRSMPPEAKTEELGALSDALSHMAVQLRERIDTIMQQRNEIKATLTSMVEGVIAVDVEERVINLNQAAAQIFSCNPSEAKGRSIQEAIRNPQLHQFVKDVLSRQEPVEKIMVVHSDKERFLNGHGTVLRDPNENQIGALIVLNDITRLRKLENIRREFVANVSHELRTPVTAIKGFVETLLDGKAEDPVEEERFLNIINKHTSRLESIIEDLLNLSKIEREDERDEIIFTEGKIIDVLSNAIEMCQDKADAKHIEIILSCPEDTIAKMDAQLLEQAMINLLDNALKYSEPGRSISIKASQTEDELIISVLDQGCGIDKKHLPRLFERFYRVDKARSRKLGGTGLGLAIVKHISQAHGGSVSVESSPGKGSTFRIHLPTA